MSFYPDNADSQIIQKLTLIPILFSLDPSRTRERGGRLAKLAYLKDSILSRLSAVHADSIYGEQTLSPSQGLPRTLRLSLCAVGKSRSFIAGTQ